MNITIQTQELTPDQYAGLFRLHRTRGHALLSTSRVDNYNELDHLDAEAAPEGKVKTKSQRLRGVLFKIFEQQGRGEDFNIFYQREMEAIISKLKMRLD